ncbi:hypothetical protein pb186bvf_012590 [Paramecium bursaria]
MQKFIDRMNVPTQVPINEHIKQIICGQECSMALSENNLYCWGSQMGLPLTNPNTPNIITQVGQVLNAAAGKDHFFAWSAEKVYAWYFCFVLLRGSNKFGKLGVESNQFPTEIDIFSEASHYGWKLLKITAGLDHSVALFDVEDEMKIFVWGSNKSQQLGFDASDENVSIPHQLDLDILDNIQDVYAQHNFTLALNSEGNVFSWGSDEFGRLGQQTLARHLKLPQQILSLNKYRIKQLALGTYHVLAVEEQGRLFSWGRGLQGQLGHEQTDQPKPVLNLPPIWYASAGESHSIVLSNINDVWCFGSNQYGQLGLVDFKQYDKPTQNNLLVKIVQISCGRLHTLVALTNEGVVLAFGSNTNGQLGIDNKKNKGYSTPLNEKSPEQVGVTIQKAEPQLRKENHDLKQKIHQLESIQASIAEQTYKVVQFISDIDQKSEVEIQQFQQSISDYHFGKIYQQLTQKVATFITK